MEKKYSELTRIGKIRRLRAVVFKTLEAYDLDVAEVKFLAIETNTHFEVRSISGDRFVLRIYSDEETTLRENQAEIFWLTALIRDTDLKVTEPIARKDGKYISVVTVPNVPPDRRCVLFSWIPGKTLDEQVTPERYFKLGQSLAKLHNHAETLNPLPPEIDPKRWDKVFYYPDEPVVYNAPAYKHLFSREDIQIIDRVIDISENMFKKLFSEKKELMLIHGDLHYWNVHVHKEELYLIDFEDVNLGYPVQDIAVTLSYGRHREGYQDWRKAFIEGYTSIRRWPDAGENVIPTLVIARTTMFINYVARIEEEPQEYIQSRLEELRNFLTAS